MTASAFRPVILAAVSTRPQAVRDISIPDQIDRGRAWIASRGMQEAFPPLIIPGESRQTLVSLTEAEIAIPEIKQLLDLAEASKVNLCVISDTDRLRGLLDQMVRALSQYGCQLYSLAQPVELAEPRDFRYYENDAQMLTYGLAQLMSHADIARFQRKRAHGMAARVDKRGLPPGPIPFGYRRPEGQETNRSAVPVIVEAERVILQRMRADYLAGKSQQFIADWLNAEGVTPRMGGKWRKRQVILVLTSPFYAGILRRNMTRTHADPRTRKRVYVKIPQDKWILAPGKHEPIWTLEDRQAIVDFKAMRGPDHRGAPRTAIFSRMLRCEHCGANLYAWQPSIGSGYADLRLRYVCSTHWAAPHAKRYEEDVAVELRPALAEVVARHLTGAAPAPAAPRAELEAVERDLVACEAKRARHERAHGAGLLTMERLADRLAEVDAEESGLLKRRAQLMDVAALAEAASHSMDRAQAFLARYDAWMAGPHPEANAALRQFLDHIVLSREGLVSIQLRG